MAKKKKILAKKKTSSRPAEKPKLGRPKLEISDEQIELASGLAGIGCSLSQIAHILRISPATLDRRIQENPKLSEALERGRSRASSKVLRAAYQMAISERHPYMTTFWLRCKLGWAEPKDTPPDDDPFNLNYARSSRDKASGE